MSAPICISCADTARFIQHSFSCCFILLTVQIDTLSAAEHGLRFGRDIQPILADHCFECHGPDEKTRKAELRLDTREGWLEARRDGSFIDLVQPEQGELLRRITSKDSDEAMPPPEAHRHPTSTQINKLLQWIAEGATYEDHWSFVKPRRALPPAVSRTEWCRNDLDRFVLAHLDELNLKPQPEATPDALSRRLSLAITGLPITVQASKRFVADYAQDTEAAIDTFVDQLLASRAYGEHFAWSWMDAGRYADSNGYQRDGNRAMWRWRDWLIEALNQNVPFDQLTREMLAGDLLVSDSLRNWQSGDLIRDAAASDHLLATGFLRNHRYDTGSGTIPEESKFENAADRMETVGTIWMGLTMHCARCHDHKFDPLAARDYYSMLAFFDKVPEYGMSLFGASHPYLRTPLATDLSKVVELDAKVQAAVESLANAEPLISKEQTKWESRVSQRGARAPKFETDELARPSLHPVSSPAWDERRVTRGLRFHYAKDPLDFDGNTQQTEPADAVKLCEGGRTFTIAFWFKQEVAGNAAILSSVNIPDGTWRGFTMDIVEGRLRLRLVYRWAHSYIEFLSREPVRLSERHHDHPASSGLMQGVGFHAFLDGNSSMMPCTHDVMNNGGAFNAKNTLVLGGSPFLPKLQGTLADVRFYDRELIASEVQFLGDRRAVSELVAIPITHRSEEDRKKTRYYFLETEANEELNSLQKAVYDAEEGRDAFIKTLPTTMVMQDGTGIQTHFRLNGSYDQLGDRMNAKVPSILPSLPRDVEPNRLALANWLTSPEHPLTARVSVNRLWQQLWGRGFVDSSENFGTQCGQPEHAELLDWLATEYIRLDWDTKALLKLIVTSATFRQSSGGAMEDWDHDPGNRLLARGPRFRLPIHTVRDQALFISGLLKTDIGGPPVLLEPLKDSIDGDEDGKVVSEHAVETHRRTLYTYWKRNAPHPMLAVFDVADRNQCDVRVRRTNTPLQALVTLNETGLAECARSFAQMICGYTNEEIFRLDYAFRSATGRAPTRKEMKYLHASLQDYRAHFRMTPDAATELAGQAGDAAWVTMANVLLNLDVTLSLE